MQTPSHFLITAALNHWLTPRKLIPSLHSKALLIGSILPDIPFVALTLGFEIYYRWFAPLPVPGGIMEYLHFDLFFNDPLWIISHNFFHSLIINSVLLLAGWWGFRQTRPWGSPLFWLAVGMQIHTVIDVFTHHSDGPLLLFPFNWQIRFASPVSYWETDQFGLFFLIFEYSLNVLILLFLFHTWRRSRLKPDSTGK